MRKIGAESVILLTAAALGAGTSGAQAQAFEQQPVNGGAPITQPDLTPQVSKEVTSLMHLVMTDASIPALRRSSRDGGDTFAMTMTENRGDSLYGSSNGERMFRVLRSGKNFMKLSLSEGADVNGHYEAYTTMTAEITPEGDRLAETTNRFNVGAVTVEAATNPVSSYERRVSADGAKNWGAIALGMTKAAEVHNDGTPAVSGPQPTRDEPLAFPVSRQYVPLNF